MTISNPQSFDNAQDSSLISVPCSLKQLLADWGAAVAGTNQAQPPCYDGPDVFLTRLTEKTSEVEPGAAFVARVREGSDGHPYIGKAIDNGASLILAQRPAAELGLTVPERVVYLQAPDTAEALAWLAAAWEGFPSRHLVMIGVTGTDGKTTTSNLLFAILKAAGLRVGLLSTIKAVIGDTEEPLDLHVTTPEAPAVQQYLRRMVDAGITHCVLEVTSHGLAQHRVTAVDFDVAVITNISHEHLDYHGSFEAYVAAKARLFEMVTQPPLAVREENAKVDIVRTAVLNQDDPSYQRLDGIPAPAQVTYGIHDPADIFASDISYNAHKTWFTVHFTVPPGQRQEEEADCVMSVSMPITTSLVGEFNLYNMLAATAAACSLGIYDEAIQQGLQSVSAISGRMERINAGQPFLTLVDFAHTPSALQRAIAAARRMTEGRVITVFGSAGKRDVVKRRLMAEVSAREADLTVLTAEDPRTESLDGILEMMADGCRSQGGVEGKTFWRIPDRGQAIYFALTLARPGDLVLICGKGHEQSMCFGAIEYPWDDRQATYKALKACLRGDPMPDLGLPTYSTSK